MTNASGRPIRRATSVAAMVGLLIAALVPSPVAAATGPRTSTAPYLVPTAAGVSFTSLLTVGDSVPQTSGGTYRMVGIPDGLGAYDNGNGTFTVLMNHELNNVSGLVRDHGSIGGFVSRYVVKKSNLQVLHGDDLVKQTYTWNTTTDTWDAATTIMNRLCSADLPAPTAFYNPATGLGTNARIFMNGEETSNGRAFAHVVSGADTGTSWELPWTGKYAWENHITSPYAQDKTIVVGLDDSRRDYSSEGATEPSEVYVWIGDKKSTGNTVERAGLGRDGILYGIRVGTPGSYDANEGTVVSGEPFELTALSDQTDNATFASLQTESIAKTITQFRRVEDGQFDPNRPNDFYFVTTDQYGASGFSKLWRLRFDDITNPTAGGTVEILIDGGGVGANSGFGTGEMFDNMTVDGMGRVLLQEDVGNQTHLGKIWAYDINSRGVLELGRHDENLFLSTSGSYIGTQDEESSGIIDMSAILGPGTYLLDDQVHMASGDPETVEKGQLLLMRVAPATGGFGFNAANNEPALVVLGGRGKDQISVLQDDSDFWVQWRRGASQPQSSPTANGEVTHGSWHKFSAPAPLGRVIVNTYAGNDRIDVSGLEVMASLFGGPARDDLLGGANDDYLSAGNGNDVLDGGPGADTMAGGRGNDLFWIRSGEGDVLVDFGLGNDRVRVRQN